MTLTSKEASKSEPGLKDYGPCVHCGHPPRCHAANACDANMLEVPCANYEPDASTRILLDIPLARAALSLARTQERGVENG